MRGRHTAPDLTLGTQHQQSALSVQLKKKEKHWMYNMFFKLNEQNYVDSSNHKRETK